MNDSTQWKDSDGDGFGDNSETGVNIPDHWPSNPAAANDSDDDGYPDNWTAQYNGNNSGGLVLDACPIALALAETLAFPIATACFAARPTSTHCGGGSVQKRVVVLGQTTFA